MSCRDVTDFICNTAEFSPSEQRYNRAYYKHKPIRDCKIKLDQILFLSREIKLSLAEKNVRQHLSNLIPGLVVSGGLSRSPAFDCLPVVSHWTERTSEPSATDSAATVCLTSTWETTYVIGEGATMQCSFGAPCWSLKTHVISPVDANSSKFSQKYLTETKTLVTTVALARRVDTPQTGGVMSAVTGLSLIRNTRVADAVDCALGMLSDAAELLTARN